VDPLAAIRDKVKSGQRLSAADGEYLFRDDVDLHAVGELADLVRRRKGRGRGAAPAQSAGPATAAPPEDRAPSPEDVVYYNLNAHLNPTNVCVYRCALCAYSCDPDDARAYFLTDEQVLARAQEAADAGCTELHIVGGAHPNKPFAWYAAAIGRLHAAFPRLHLKAFTAVEIDWFAHQTRRTPRSILEELIAAGLGSLPGGGAEIFDPEVRSVICPRKADARAWLAIHRTAHELGLRSNASMLYAHIEHPEHRVDHLLQLRRLQDDTGGFQAFVPLAFHPENTPLGASGITETGAGGVCRNITPGASLQACWPLLRRTGLLDLRVMAVSRLMLDNFDHLKAYWISLGIGTAQVALAYGADDLDGTVRHERIHHDAGAQSPKTLAVEELRALIVEAGREPVERDTLYRRVEREGKLWEVGGG